jgi:cytochrome c oxidase subunit 1
VPTGIKIFNWIFTIYGGSINLKTPMYFSLGFIALFIVGGLSGVMLAAPPADWLENDTYFVVAHIHYVLFGGTIFGLFSGFYYWFPKVTGRMLDEILGKIHFWLFFIGMNLTFAFQHVLGINGMPRRIYTYPSGMGWDFWNLVSTIGAYTIALGMVFFFYNVAASFRHGKLAGNDPWDGRTLEWSIPSPPPHYNFAEIPTVRARDPFWLQKYPETGHGHAAPVPVAGGAHHYGEIPDSDNGSPGEHDEAHGHIHMPDPSIFPLFAALGLALTLAGLLVGAPPPPPSWLSIIGILLLLFGVYGWAMEPVNGY